jgi:RHS repeat-associated protein
LGVYEWVFDAQGGHIGQQFWAANTRDAELHVLAETTAGGAISTTQTFDPNTGRPLTTAATSNSGTIASQVYAFDSLGNLIKRSWLNLSGATVTERACYDDLNRLVSYKLTTSATCPQSGGTLVTVAYDSLGNITGKSDICSGTCFGYGANGAGPHALTSITGTYNGVTNPAFTYDQNGNMIAGANRTITSTSFNMAASIVQGLSTLNLTYDANHNRAKQVIAGTTTKTTYYINDSVTGAMEEKFVVGSTVTWHDYIPADGKMAAERFCTGPASCTTGATFNYFTLDHLGSITAIADATGAVLERLNYDPWGKRRNADGTAAACGTVSSSASRGFTGQEMMDSVCFINFNARVYDPSLGRFMSADPVTQSFFNLQLLNRYSYVGNNPLSLTDPSGNCAGIVGCFFAFATFGLSEFINEPLLRSVPILGDLFVIAASIACGPAGPACAAVAAAGVAGAEGGRSGNVLKAFALTFVEAEGLQLVGGAKWSRPAKALASGLIGGAVSAAGGGKFSSGFLAAGFSTLATPYVGELAGGNRVAGTLISAVLGGASSVLGGGKFANGAITGAFAYAASSWAEEGSIESPRKVSPEQYESMFNENGLSHAYTVSPAEDAFIREFFNAADSDVFDGLSGKQSALYASDSASGNESGQIRVFVDEDNIVANFVAGTPCGNGSTTCLNMPPVGSGNGRLLFDTHVHPDGNPTPSPLDLWTSATNGGRIGVIQYGPGSFTVYQGQCASGGCSSTFHGLNWHN